MIIEQIRKLSSLRRDARGTAAIEFAGAGLLLALGLLNAVDFGYYMYQRMEVENAAQVGAQAAWKICSQMSMLPATQNCSGLNTAITTAVRSTTLGSSVNLASGYPTEGYYCANASNQMQLVGSVTSSEPTDCSAAGNANTSPGDYLQIRVTFAYAPMFGITVMGLSGITSISTTSWMRLS
jgi:Flp pilus assembly protein TadG